ncbi:MAG: peptide ligase PGM1-related protein [Actinomycetota bacterium]|nr:peptide ligase PGM1-related protein [Actinomycetota bacterium]
MATGTLVVLPSLSFPVAELVKIKGIVHYEERLLFTLLLLRDPDQRIVYLSSLAIDPAVVDYYLGFLPDPAGARRRLHLVPVGESGPRPLSEKLLGRPDLVPELRALLADPRGARLLPFNVTPAEWALADALGVPLYGSRTDLVALGSKSGSRRVARRAGVAVLEGDEALFSVEETAEALARLRAERPGAGAAVIKLNNGFSGQGNAIVDLAGLADPLPASPTVFCAAEESWPSFAAKVAAEGAVVEELVEDSGLASPSVQLHLTPGGRVELVSTHDQVLGGPAGQVYLGCRFPAAAGYRASTQDAARRVGEVLAGEGVVGWMGVDFVVMPGPGGAEVTLSEINLRMGGTTHPYWMARLATGGVYDPAAGELVAGGAAKCYVATDNLLSPSLVGRPPAAAIEAVEGAGLGYDPARATGTTLHLLGALTGYGKMGVTCIGDSEEEAEERFAEVGAKLGAAGG